MAALDYPRELIQIQILDDSNDCTTRLARRLTAVLRRRGLQVDLLHRDTRHGFKAGALAAGLAHARGDVLAIFDADFVPRRDFLRRTWTADHRHRARQLRRAGGLRSEPLRSAPLS